MTQWVENPAGGRDRGPSGLARAWVEVLVRPRRFFENGVSPGDQAPGLTFAIAVAFVAVAGRLLLAPSSLSGYERVAAATGSPVATAVVVLGAACFLVAPIVLHLAAALATLSLIPVVDDRAGVGETVQVIAYAAAPAVFTAVPVPAVRLLGAAYGAILLVVGLAVVHETSLPRAFLAGAVPALFVFGLALGGIAALEGVLGLEVTRESGGA
ncbi:YIP1 family protein [Natronomonas salina]|uniref:YIP1 family protein n=1 Tax=Natronomonas salina TaxID=1710540 RepID=UPI0015B62867|nr:YIP1 family protein [Natronomonas salina]QLD87792.1 YIP1 family protein [Natronomonas salina]